MALLLKRSTESVQQPSHQRRELIEIAALINGYEPEATGDFQTGLQFTMGSKCDTHVVMELPRCATTTAFRDVERNGNAGASKLGRESITLNHGKCGGQPIAPLDEVHASLPDLEVAIGRHVAASAVCVPRTYGAFFLKGDSPVALSATRARARSSRIATRPSLVPSPQSLVPSP